MDSENTNGACYAEELEFIVQLITALEYLVSVLEDNPVLYPAFMADVVCLIHGRRCKLEGDKEIFVNGLEVQIEELYETMERLELEVQYELTQPMLGEGDGEEV